MADIARTLGHPNADLLVEDRSANTFENVDFSHDLLESPGRLHEPQIVRLVSSQWHMRRVLLTTRKRFPAGITFLCCPTLDGCNRENWTQASACRREVESEALLLVTLLQTGAI